MLIFLFIMTGMSKKIISSAGCMWKFQFRSQKFVSTWKYGSLLIKFIFWLLTEIYNSLNGLNPTFMSDIFQCKTSGYTLRSEHQLALPITNTATFGLHSKTFMGSILWNKLPRDVKSATSISQFKLKLKNLVENSCSWQYCT